MDQYPRGKLNADDEGALAMKVGVRDKTVIVDFGKPVTWFGLGYTDAVGLANLLLQHAKTIAPKNADDGQG